MSECPADAIGIRFTSSASFDDIGVVVGTSSGLILSHTPSPSLSTTSGWVVSSRTRSSTRAGIDQRDRDDVGAAGQRRVAAVLDARAHVEELRGLLAVVDGVAAQRIELPAARPDAGVLHAHAEVRRRVEVGQRRRVVERDGVADRRLVAEQVGRAERHRRVEVVDVEQARVELVAVASGGRRIGVELDGEGLVAVRDHRDHRRVEHAGGVGHHRGDRRERADDRADRRHGHGRSTAPGCRSRSAPTRWSWCRSSWWRSPRTAGRRRAAACRR